MGRQVAPAGKAVKRSAAKVVMPACTKAAKQEPREIPKDAANFLKQRMGKKVKELRLPGNRNATQADAGMDVAEASSLLTLQADAARRGGQFEQDGQANAHAAEETSFSVNSNREAENNRRRFFIELRKVMAAADIIIEVLDARDPQSCRSDALEREVLGAGKRLVLLLNKIDLVPREAAEAWMKYLQRQFPVVAFKAAHGGASRPTHAMTSVSRASEGLMRSTHAVIGADELMQLLKNYARSGGAKNKAHVSVGVVGYPNTGKSSVINSMRRHSAVEVGGKAGVTKVMQEVQLDSKVTLIDSPGVVFEGSSEDPAVVLRNVVRVESVSDPVGVVEAMLTKAPRHALLQFYGLQQDFSTITEFLSHVARCRGKLRRGSGLDLPAAATSVISDWTTGKFRYYVMPPVVAEADTTSVEVETLEVVSHLAPAFDIDALFNGDSQKPVILGAPQDADEDMDADGGSATRSMVEVDMAAMAR